MATPFHSGTFKVKLVLPSDYPASPPKGPRALPCCAPPPPPPQCRAPLSRAPSPPVPCAARSHRPVDRAAPAGYFLTKIYHPNISKAGEICVNTLKRDWKQARDRAEMWP